MCFFPESNHKIYASLITEIFPCLQRSDSMETEPRRALRLTRREPKLLILIH